MNKGTALAPTLVLLAGSCAAWAADGPDVQFHGFVSEGYLVTKNDALFSQGTQDTGSFDFNEFALNVTATPVNRLRVGMQIFAQDLGDYFNDKPQIDWAYGDYSFPTVGKDLDLAVTAGRIKIGHGMYGDYRDLDMTRTQVFQPMAVYSPLFRDFFIAVNGAGLHGTKGVGPLGSLDFMGYVGTNNVDVREGPLHELLGGAGIDTTTASQQLTAGGNITWNTPIDGLRFKYSLLQVRDVQISGTATASSLFLTPGTAAAFSIPHLWDNVVSAEYQRDKLTLSAEYEYEYMKTIISGTPIFVFIPMPVMQYNIVKSTYLTAAYRVHPKVELAGGWQWSQTDTVTAGKSKYYGFDFSARYDIVDHWLVKGEYGWYHGTGLLLASQQADATLHPTWGYVALKTTFDF